MITLGQTQSDNIHPNENNNQWFLVSNFLVNGTFEMIKRQITLTDDYIKQLSLQLTL